MQISESSRLPTDAQARLLATVEAEQPCFLGANGHLWKRGNPDVVVMLGMADEVKAPGLEGRAVYPRGQFRPATCQIAMNEGWIVNDPQSWLPHDGQCVVALGEDGVIALGRWRQRKMAEPAPAAPVLEGRDREVVALAEHALRLGYQLVPTTDDARKHARRLKRAGWVERDYTSSSTMSVVPSASGLIEVNPDAADVAPIL